VGIRTSSNDTPHRPQNSASIRDGNIAGGSPFPYNYVPGRTPRFTFPFGTNRTDPNFDWTSAYQANLAVEQQ
jgi:hypothetical protein